MSDWTEAELAIQKSGARARADGRSVFDNPYYMPINMPAVTGDSVETWNSKALAWELGWKMEDAVHGGGMLLYRGISEDARTDRFKLKRKDWQMLTMKQQENGRYSVYRGGELVKADMTNAEAWRMIDRDAGEPISRSEKVSEWINSLP